MADLQRTAVTSEKAPAPLGAYSVGMTVNAGRLVYVAGQVGVNTAGELVGPGDAAAQPATRQVLQNIGGVLEAAGAGFSNVVEFTTYVVGRSSVQGFIPAATAKETSRSPQRRPAPTVAAPAPQCHPETPYPSSGDRKR